MANNDYQGNDDGDHNDNCCPCNKLCSCICSWILPPIGIYWRFGCGKELFICIILTLLGYLPGVIYAVIMVGCD
eukprot:CAMPEP_0201602608 /NCGR_PEP_ID=MMETSP0492-20130828/3283_1 /ASSEMBLY_ACC=CAM_ASM_000837 /TAXON_ID=420259 /ORGANISM="Thalassiosira gravida, Strain GMp14c1" /LENGTH=73 /DNA_ID=CAMNT_0048066159 /DNA_START=102 /DNA_END=323 /DNA_ORIENTATION=+